MNVVNQKFALGIYSGCWGSHFRRFCHSSCLHVGHVAVLVVSNPFFHHVTMQESWNLSCTPIKWNNIMWWVFGSPLPDSAKTRIPCLTTFVLPVKKSLRKMQYSNYSLKKLARFLQNKLTPSFFCHPVVCSEVLDIAANLVPSKIIKSILRETKHATQDLRGDTQACKNVWQCLFFTAPWRRAVARQAPFWPGAKLILWWPLSVKVQKQASYWAFASVLLAES